MIDVLRAHFLGVGGGVGTFGLGGNGPGLGAGPGVGGRGGLGMVMKGTTAPGNCDSAKETEMKLGMSSLLSLVKGRVKMVKSVDIILRCQDSKSDSL